MPAAKRVTLYLDARLLRAVQRKSAETAQTVSDLVNDAVRAALAEDAGDLQAIRARKREPRRPFLSFVADLKRRRRS